MKNESDREWRVFLRADFPEGITGDLPAEAIVIPPGGEEKLAFSGESLLEEGAEEKVTVKILSGNEDSSPAYVITEESFVLRAAKSALGISARINGEANIVASPGGELQYAVTIRNNTGTPLSDIAASASINGQMFDFRSLSSSGRISSGGAKIIWDSGTTNELSRLDPGFEARLFFTIRVREDFPIRNFNDKNFVLGADIKAEASGGSAGKAVSIARIRTKVSGKLDLSQKLLYRDADSGFVDDGPFPPRVGEPTEYIVRWKLSDYGSDMDNIVVSASLGRGVRLTGEKKVFVGELTEKDGVVQWRLPKLFAGTGVLSGPPEAIFQVSFTPTPGDAGVEGVVIEETSVIADDSYAGVRFEDLLPRLTTGLRDDATVKLGEGIVTR